MRTLERASIKLLVMHLLCLNILFSLLLGRKTLKLKLLLILHLLHQFDSILTTQGIDILLLKFINFNSLFDLPLLSQLWIQVIFTLTGYKSCHVLLHEGLLDDFDDTGSCFVIFNQKHID